MSSNKPVNLYNELVSNSSRNLSMTLRNDHKFIQPTIRSSYGESTFASFFTKLLNNIYAEVIALSLSLFEKTIFSNFSTIYDIFITHFSYFHVNVKVFI